MCFLWFRVWLQVSKNVVCFWFQVSITPIKDSSGSVTNFVGVLQDVTERKASEAAFKLRDHALSNLSEVHILRFPCTYEYLKDCRVAE